VLDQRLETDRPAPSAAPIGAFAPVIESPVEPARQADAARSAAPGQLVQTLSLAVGVEAVWRAISDPALIVGCVPGARLISVDGEHIRGELTVALGPIQASFQGQASVSYDPQNRSGRVSGSGRDPTSGTQLSAAAGFEVTPAGADASTIRLEMTYDLQGPLTQFGRGPIVQALAAEMTDAVSRNLAAWLAGKEPPASQTRLNAGRLLWQTLLRWLRGAARKAGRP
jgi:carbon-monoxide dehydrogenase small subunit